MKTRQDSYLQQKAIKNKKDDVRIFSIYLYIPDFQPSIKISSGKMD